MLGAGLAPRHLSYLRKTGWFHARLSSLPSMAGWFHARLSSLPSMDPLLGVSQLSSCGAKLRDVLFRKGKKEIAAADAADAKISNR